MLHFITIISTATKHKNQVTSVCNISEHKELAKSLYISKYKIAELKFDSVFSSFCITYSTIINLEQKIRNEKETLSDEEKIALKVDISKNKILLSAYSEELKSRVKAFQTIEITEYVELTDEEKYYINEIDNFGKNLKNINTFENTLHILNVTDIVYAKKMIGVRNHGDKKNDKMQIELILRLLNQARALYYAEFSMRYRTITSPQLEGG